MTVEIIAEIAQGFEGRPEQARLLIKAAASAKADAVKFQLVYAEELATPDYKYYDLFKSLEMSDETWEGLAYYAKELGIELNLDIFGIKSLNLAQKIGISTIKLHGTDLSNIGLLNAVAGSSIQKILLGVGGGYSEEIAKALKVLENKEVVVLVGFQGYPTPTEGNQIARVRFFYDKLCGNNKNIKVGFADHASPDSPLRYALAAMAIGAGAVVIEKHITLGQVMKLEDYESALNPDEFAEFTNVIKNCALAFGVTEDDEDFGMSEFERAYREMIRRHVVTSRELPAGTVIEPSDLTLKRTAAQEFFIDLNLVYKKKLVAPLKVNSPISQADLEN
jgi:sialic acid synthase SpsE